MLGMPRRRSSSFLYMCLLVIHWCIGGFAPQYHVLVNWHLDAFTTTMLSSTQHICSNNMVLSEHACTPTVTHALSAQYGLTTKTPLPYMHKMSTIHTRESSNVTNYANSRSVQFGLTTDCANMHTLQPPGCRDL